MEDLSPRCPLGSHPTDEPKLPCAECNATLPNAVQDWFHKAWFDGTVDGLTLEEVGEALHAMRSRCSLDRDPNADLSALAEVVRGFLPLKSERRSFPPAELG